MVMNKVINFGIRNIRTDRYGQPITVPIIAATQEWRIWKAKSCFYWFGRGGRGGGGGGGGGGLDVEPPRPARIPEEEF